MIWKKSARACLKVTLELYLDNRSVFSKKYGNEDIHK